MAGGVLRGGHGRDGRLHAALTKAITTYTTEGWGHVFTHFQPYMLAITGLGTVFLSRTPSTPDPSPPHGPPSSPSTHWSASSSGSPSSPTAASGGRGSPSRSLALAVLVAGVVILARPPWWREPGGVPADVAGARPAACEDEDPSDGRGGDPTGPTAHGGSAPVEAGCRGPGDHPSRPATADRGDADAKCAGLNTPRRSAGQEGYRRPLTAGTTPDARGKSERAPEAGR